MLDLPIASRRIKILEPEKISTAPIVPIVEAMVAIVAATGQSTLEENQAEAALSALASRGASPPDHAYIADPVRRAKGVTDELEAARRACEEAQTRRADLYAAQGPLVNGYIDAVNQHRAAWKKALAGKVPASLSKITTAVRFLETAQAELGDYLDMAQGLSEGGYSAQLSGPDTYAIPLSRAIDAAAQTSAAARSQLETIRRRGDREPRP